MELSVQIVCFFYLEEISPLEEKMLGEFIEGKLHGLGIMINIDGIITEGEWNDGKMKVGHLEK